MFASNDSDGVDTLPTPAMPGTSTNASRRVVITPDAPVVMGDALPVGTPSPDILEPGPPIAENLRFAPPTIDRERNQKCRRTCYVVDREDKTTTDRNILLPLQSLLSFLEASFVCKRCHKRLGRTAEDPLEPPLGVEVFGLAFVLNFNCICGLWILQRKESGRKQLPNWA
jgi:hypothetical protein